jgi:hypothetical protein
MAHRITRVRRPVPIISARAYGPPKPGTFAWALQWPMYDYQRAIEENIRNTSPILRLLMQAKR